MCIATDQLTRGYDIKLKGPTSGKSHAGLNGWHELMCTCAAHMTNAYTHLISPLMANMNDEQRVIIADSACIMYYLFLYDRDGNLFIDDISFYKPMFMLDCNQCFYNLVCTRFRVGHQFNMS